MRRHVRSHTYGYTACAVHQQVRESCRQHGRLTTAVVVVELHIYGIFVDIVQHLFCQFLQSRLGVTHGSRTVAVHTTEVTLTIYQRITHCPRLCQANQCAVYTAVAVRVVLTHYLADDCCTFLCRFVARVTHIPHRVQHAAVNGLEAVTHVGQRTGYNHTHGIIDVRGSHLFINLHGNNSVFCNHCIVLFIFSSLGFGISFRSIGGISREYRGNIESDRFFLYSYALFERYPLP